MPRTLSVKLGEKEIELLERIRDDFNQRSKEVNQGELYADHEVELLLNHIIRDYASTLRLYNWGNPA